MEINLGEFTMSSKIMNTTFKFVNDYEPKIKEKLSEVFGKGITTEIKNISLMKTKPFNQYRVEIICEILNSENNRHYITFSLLQPIIDEFNKCDEDEIYLDEDGEIYKIYCDKERK